MKYLILLLGLLLLTSRPTGRAAGLQASDGANQDALGGSAGNSGGTALFGASGDDTFRGSAYLFRNLDTITGTVSQAVKLSASDRSAGDEFGVSSSLSGNTALISAEGKAARGAAYLFRNLNTDSVAATESAQLIASDGASGDSFGYSVGLSGSSGLVGAFGSNSYRGSAYLFRNLDTVTGTVTESAKLAASDGASFDYFGASSSLSGNLGVIGAYGTGSGRGSAYVFHNLDTATGTITEAAKLAASDGQEGDDFGGEASLAGTTALVGALAKGNFRGAAYVFRNLDTAAGVVMQNVKLLASDGAPDDDFGFSVSLSGNVGLVGANERPIGANSAQGAAYLFRNLDTATGTITESVEFTASDGKSSNFFGSSVSLDGDRFVIGATGANGASASSGKGYSGSVSAVTNLDAGNVNRTISGLSFLSREDWIIGDQTDGNAVTLSLGDTATVKAVGKAVYIGKNAGSDANLLDLKGRLDASQVYIGSVTGNAGNILQMESSATFGTTDFRLALGSVFRLQGDFTAVSSLLGYLGTADLQTWNGTVWKTVDGTNYTSLITSSYSSGYTELRAVPEPTIATMVLASLGLAGLRRRIRPA